MRHVALSCFALGLAVLSACETPPSPIDDDAGAAALASEALFFGDDCTARTLGDHDYLFCTGLTSPKSWDSARADCGTAGMELVTIDDAAENTFVRNGLSILNQAWIGASDRDVEGAWKWSASGTQFWTGTWAGAAIPGQYANWGLLQPDDLFSQDCATMTQLDGKWQDQNCGELRSYVCESLDEPEPPPTAPGADTACWSAPGLAAGAAWPMRGLCPLRRSATRFVGSQVNTVNWVYASGGDIRTGVAIAADGAIYFGSSDDYIYALNPNGTLKWRYRTNGDVSSSPMLTSDGAVVIGSDDDYLYSLNANNGVLRWRYNTGGDVQSSPSVAPDGTIYVGSDANRLVALNPGTGAVRFSYLTGHDIDSSPALLPNGTIIVGSDDDYVYALKPDNGLTEPQRLLWRTNVGSDVNSIPAIGPPPDHFIYVRTHAGKVRKLDPADGHIIATFDGPSDLDTDSSPAIGLDGDIYVGLAHKVYALRPDLTSRWSFTTGNDIRTSPVVGADGTIYVGSDDERIYALRPSNGTSVWSLEASGLLSAFRGTPAIAKNGAILIGNDDNKLYSIGSFACSAAHPCGNGMGPCTGDVGCASGTVCGYGIAERYGLPSEFGVCWDPGDCALLSSTACGGFRTLCGTCCTPSCGAAGSPDGCGGTCRPCVAGADSDRDGTLDCDEQNDGTQWTNPVVFNGVSAFQGPACSSAPTCADVDTLAEIAACFSTTESQLLWSGWDFDTGDTDICDPGFGFEPSWSSCHEDFAVWYQAAIKLESTGRHCFEVEGLTSSQCGVLFVDDALVGQISGSGPKCTDMPAGVHAVRWFYETTNDTANEVHVKHCFGGALDCDPQEELAPQDLLPPGDAAVALCDPGECSEACPCPIGTPCDPLDPNGFCEPGIECRPGVAARFELTAPAVCWDGVGCGDVRSEAFECGEVTDHCGLCPSCPNTPSCAGKSCGSDGCFGSCGDRCGPSEGGCESDEDCEEGLVCLHDAGPAFGLAAGINVCAPIDCRSLSASRNPCRDPDNQGEMTVCGICPQLSPDCEDRECGPDGAGGSCGQVPTGNSCEGGTSLPVLNQPVPDPLPDRSVPTVTTAEVGTLPGQFSVGSSGDSAYRVPLSLPPGRGGLTPELALSYSSGRGNGFVGMGWALEGMQAVTRCARTISQDDRVDALRFDERDAFCLNGERLVEIGTQDVNGETATEYALENNDFSSILAFEADAGDDIQGPARFERTGRDGRVSVFGGTTRARILGPGIAGSTPKPVVQTWALSRITDRHGNYAEIDYEQPRRAAAGAGPYDAFGDALTRREYYPTSIAYSLHPSDPHPQVAITFEYDDSRPDPMSAWRSGTNIQVNRLLSRIIVLADRQNRHFVLGYEDGSNSADPSQSRLTSVQECAGPSLFEPPTACLPATTFNYDRMGQLRAPVAVGDATDRTIQTVLDFDGDGRDDLLVIEDGADKLMLSRVSADGDQVGFETVHVVVGGPHYSASSSGSPPLAEGMAADYHVLDWDNDGRDDILDFTSGYIYQSVSDQQGQRFERHVLSQIEPADERSGRRQRQYFLIDLDGDGRKDLLDCKNGNWRYRLRFRTVGSGFGSWSQALPGRMAEGDEIDSCPALTDSSAAPRQSYNQVVDLDGDGSEELLFVVDDRVGTYFPVREENFRVYTDVTFYRFSIVGPVTRPSVGVGNDAIQFDYQPIYTVPRRDRHWFALKLALPSDDDGTAEARVVDTHVPSGAKVLDMNGDALPDFYRIDACLSEPDRERCLEYGRVRVDSWINTGVAAEEGDRFIRNARLELPHDQSWPFNRSTVEGAARLARVLDHDGDAKQDVLLPVPSLGWQVLRSTGTGFVLEPLPFDLPAEEHSGPTAGIASNLDIRMEIWNGASPVVLDLNGDGLADLLRRRITSFSSAGGRPEGYEWQVSLRAGPSLPRLTRVVNGLGERLDIDYALLTDADAEVYEPDSGFACEYPQRCAPLRRSVVSETRSGRSGATPSELIVKLRQRYHYGDGRIDLWGRGFVGFQSRATHVEPGVQPASYVHSIFSTYDNHTRDDRTNSYFRALVPESTTDSRSDGTLRVRNIVTRETVALHPADAPGTLHRVEVRRDERLSEARGSGSEVELQHWATIVPEDQIDKYGNPHVVARGIPADDADQPQLMGLRFDVPEGLRISASEYMHDTDSRFEVAGKRHLPELQVEAFLQADGPTPWGETVANTRETGFDYYDNGSLRKIEVEPRTDPLLVNRASFQRETTLDRDDFGNVVREVTRRDIGSSSADRETQYIYNDTGYAPGHFPIEVINAQGHHSTVEYDRRYGTLARVTDPNGASQDWYYDDFGRLVAFVDADNTVTTAAYSSADSVPMRVRTRTDGGEDQTVDFDWFGRPVHSLTRGFGGSALIADAIYDDLDRVVSHSRPHQRGTAGIDDSLTETAITYDAVGRVINEHWLDQPPGGSPVQMAATRCYSALTQCTRNPRGFTTCSRADRLGRTISTWDPPTMANPEVASAQDLPGCESVLNGLDNRTDRTAYAYGEWLESITDSRNNRTRIWYDRYGRRTRLSDPDTGISNYTWDAFGQLTRTEDAEGQVSELEYDKLSRQVLRRDIDLFGSAVDGETRWFFDGENPDSPDVTPGAFVGALTLTETPEGHRSRYEYDAVGHIARIEQRLAGATDAPLAMTFEDYAFGRAQLTRYPSAGASGDVAVRKSYDSFGHLLSVRREGQSGEALWTLDETNAYNQVAQERFGNGLRTHYAHDSMGRISTITDDPSTGSPMRILGLHYDANGNVISRADGSQSEALQYDHLDRLRFSTIGGQSSSTSYDRLGNIIHRGDLGTYSYGATNAADPGGLYVNAFKPHAVSAAGVFNYAYDASGNMTERRDVLFNTSSHFSWTRFGKISQMWRNAATPDAGLDLVTLTYDADGQRIRQESSTKTTDYLAGLYERRRSGSGVVEHIYNIDNDLRTVAQLTVSEDGASSSSSELLFMHADHLGSAELLTQSDGAVAERRSYRAFGGARDPNDWSASQSPDDAVVRFGFTGHEREDEYGLVNMVGRYYDPALQRFLSADPFVMRPFDSQSINRYSYVSNNPLGYVDPSGWQENDLDAGVLPPVGATDIQIGVGEGGWYFSWQPESGADVEFGQEFTLASFLDLGWEPGVPTADLAAVQNSQFAQLDVIGPAVTGAQGTGAIDSGGRRQESGIQSLARFWQDYQTWTAANRAESDKWLADRWFDGNVRAVVQLRADVDLMLPFVVGGMRTPPVGIASAVEAEMLGARGTQMVSKTIWKGPKGMRIDIENPNPGQRPGQIHFQQGDAKYLYDPIAKVFKDAPRAINELLETSGVKDAVAKGLKFLGEL